MASGHPPPSPDECASLGRIGAALPPRTRLLQAYLAPYVSAALPTPATRCQAQGAACQKVMGTKAGNSPNWAEMMGGVESGIRKDMLLQGGPFLPASGYLATAPTPAWDTEAVLAQEDP